MKYANNVGELIGNTPLIKINTLSNKTNTLILAKCEFLNPNGSMKDRVAKAMIDDALKQGIIDKNGVIIEPTSGNTGIGLASVCASYGMSFIAVMPESMSLERRALMEAFGAKLVLSKKELGMNGAIDIANKLQAKTPNSIILKQFENKSNPNIHLQTTAKEIIKDMQDSNIKIDIFISGVGTGGSFSSIAKALKQINKDTKTIAVEPSDSAVISGKNPNAHKIQGIGAGFIPKNLNTSLIDEVVTINNNDAFLYARDIAKKEGLMVGISSGANLKACYEVAKRAENKNKTILTLLYDSGERYLSSGLYSL